MEKSLELLYADNKRLIEDAESRIQKIKEDIDSINKISDESIELVFPDSFELIARTMSSVTFKIQNEIVNFYTQPIGIFIDFDILDDSFPKVIEDHANCVTGEGLQLLVDYFISLLGRYYDDLGLLHESKFNLY